MILGHGVKGQGQLWHSMYKYLVGTIATTVFAQSLTNFTCTVLDDERRNPIDYGSRVPYRSRSTLALYVQVLVGTIATTVFAQSLSNFTFQLCLMRGGTLLIMGHGMKGQGQLWHSVYKTLWAR